MNYRCLPSPIKILLLVCGVLSDVLCLNVSFASDDDFDHYARFTHGQKNEVLQENVQRARKLIKNLSVESYETFDKVLSKKDVYAKVVTQAGYYGKEGTDQAYSPLVIYKRVWIYDAGIALSLAIQEKDPSADARALWLLKNGFYTRDPENPAKALFAGWPFSQNQKNYGDDWTDCRFINGANLYAIQAIADYIVSDYYLELNSSLKSAYSKLYANALYGVLYHMESKGPNRGLISAGWSLNVLEDYDETNYSYNKILDVLGYGPKKIEGYTQPIMRVRARNIVAEHNINLLHCLNHALMHYDRLFERNDSFTYRELDEIYTSLRDGIYEKLYDSNKKRFITGRTSAGEIIPYTAIDNTSWLTLALNLKELSNEQIERLSGSLLYTVNQFTKDFEIAGENYFGAHYFEEGFEDTYIRKSDAHSKYLHVEATCGLICGLLEFANVFPDDPNTPTFRYTASELWKGMQRFIDNFGFVYASNSLKDVAEPIEASVSAIWYLKTCHYLENTIKKKDRL